jgi:hypothetical protein
MKWKVSWYSVLFKEWVPVAMFAGRQAAERYLLFQRGTRMQYKLEAV